MVNKDYLKRIAKILKIKQSQITSFDVIYQTPGYAMILFNYDEDNDLIYEGDMSDHDTITDKHYNVIAYGWQA
jgi:hypothetical protein